MVNRDVVVVGGSAGSGAVLRRFLPELPRDLPASIFIVTHTGPGAADYLAQALQERSALRVGVAVDGQPIEHGHVYLAPADRHLLVFPGLIRLGRGPRENMSRPAIDPLFRSAAAAFGGRVVGLVLTGYLNDGAAGLFAIKRRGGVALVQQPLEAEVPQMPQAALEAVDADEIVHSHDVARVLEEVVRRPAPDKAPPAPDLDLEVRVALGARLGSAELAKLADPAPLSCPHCHGVLSEIRGPGPLRYRCQTGHAFTAEATFEGQQPEVDEALVVAMRVMEERVALVSRMAREARDNGRTAMAELYESRAEEYGRYAETLRAATTRALPPDLAAE